VPLYHSTNYPKWTNTQTHTHGQYLPTVCCHPPLHKGSTSQSRDEQKEKERKKEKRQQYSDVRQDQQTVD